MTSLPVTELTQRAREIFRRVVEEYIASGQPVGSKTLAADGTLNLSPASIRSVLADLETAGLLAAPHTSAGRMPTDAGLRIFVDGMMRVAEPTAQEQAAIEARLAEHAEVRDSVVIAQDGTLLVGYVVLTFAALLGKWRDEGVRETRFLIGAADGHGEAGRAKADLLIAFGAMTWPHLLVRAMLAEQLWRATSILAGHPYHRSG